MREEYNSVLSTLTEADTDISVKPKYRPIYRSISGIKSQMVILFLQKDSNFKGAAHMQNFHNNGK